MDLVFPKRGRRSIESLLLYSGYPIGLFRKGRVHPLADERLVYPAPATVPYVPPDPREAEGGDPRDRRKGRGAEIRNLREAGFGDDPRDVHWPQTARQGKFIVKERASEEGRDALVALDTHRPAGADAPGRTASSARSPRPPGSRCGSSRVEAGWDFCSGASSCHPAPARRIAAASCALSPSSSPAASPRDRPRPFPARSPCIGRGEGRSVPRERAGRPRAGAPIPFLRERLLASGRSRSSLPFPLFFSNALELAVLLVYLGVLALFLAARAPGRMPRLGNRALNLAGLLYLPVIVLDVRFGSQTLLKTMLHLLLFTTLFKLAAIRRERDLSLALVLAGLLFVASVSTSFHCAILLYVLLVATVGWAVLVKWALWRDLAAAPEEWSRDRAARELPGRGPLFTSVLSTV